MKKILVLLLATVTLQAASIDWSGTYRFEYFDFTKTSLDSDPAALNSGSKSYGLHFLTLRPRILASDGISIYSRFDLLTNQDPYYANSQIGQQWGGSGYTGAAGTNGGVNNTTRNNQVNTDLTAYVTEKALAGLFHNIRLEEQKIRKDPAAQVTGILKKVFGK